MDNLNIKDMLDVMLKSAMTYLPVLLITLAILIVGWLLIRLVTRLLKKLLTKIGINKLSDYINHMELFGKSSFKIDLVKIITGFVYYLLMLMLWILAADQLGFDAVIVMLNDIINYLPTLLVAFIYLMFGILLADMLRKFLLSALESLKIPSAKLISGFVFYFIVVNVLLGALDQAQISTDFIANNISIILGGVVLAFAIGYGLASQDVARNLIASFYWKDRFQVGDVVQFDGTRGTIVSVENSYFLLKNDVGEVIVPMSQINRTTTTLIKRAEPKQ